MDILLLLLVVVGGGTVVVHRGLFQEHLPIWETAHNASVAKQVTFSQENRSPANSDSWVTSVVILRRFTEWCAILSEYTRSRDCNKKSIFRVIISWNVFPFYKSLTNFTWWRQHKQKGKAINHPVGLYIVVPLEIHSGHRYSCSKGKETTLNRCIMWETSYPFWGSSTVLLWCNWLSGISLFCFAFSWFVLIWNWNLRKKPWEKS